MTCVIYSKFDSQKSLILIHLCICLFSSIMLERAVVTRYYCDIRDIRYKVVLNVFFPGPDKIVTTVGSVFLLF